MVMSDKIIYLDNNATTRVAPEVFEAMQPYFCELYGNPSSIHRFGGSVAGAIENARRQVAELLGANYRDRDGNASEIIFTSCGTEGDNAAINAALAALPERRKIVTTAVEHPAVLHYCDELASGKGYTVEKIGVDSCGRLDMAALQAELELREYEISAGGGAVTVKINGKKQILSLDIAPEIVDPDDIETLSDILVAAVNEAIKRVEDTNTAEMSKVTGSVGFPGLF